MNIKTILFISLIIGLGCSKSNNEIEKYFQSTWCNNNRVIIANGNYHSSTGFDAINKRMTGDTAFKIDYDKNQVIFKNIGHVSVINNGLKSELKYNPDTIVFDTLFFDIMNLRGSKLLLYKDSSELIMALNSCDNINRNETSFMTRPTFKLSGLTIGDSINRNTVNIKNTYNFGYFSTEEAELIENEDINLELIGDHYIYKMKQENIHENEIDNIITIINKKLRVKPIHKPLKKSGEVKTEQYIWDVYGIRISLLKMIYLGNDPYMKIAMNSNWSLSYEDYVIQRVLEIDFYSDVPKSTIIK